MSISFLKIERIEPKLLKAVYHVSKSNVFEGDSGVQQEAAVGQCSIKQQKQVESSIRYDMNFSHQAGQGLHG